MKIRKCALEEITEAIELAWSVFLEFEAPEYSQEGIDEFRHTLDDEKYINGLQLYGAFENDEIVGILAMRAPQHISLFFVKAEYHRNGIGRKLFERMRKDYCLQEFTVNSSPYAVEVYRSLGFVNTDTEQVYNGIRFTPMKFDFACVRNT